MPAWHNSPQWRPPPFGPWNRKDITPFLAWLAPGAIGAVLMVSQKAVTGSFPPAPEQLDQLGLFGEHFAATLLWSPLWGFPAVVAALPALWIMLRGGWFGWASALVAGAVAGITVPIIFGWNYALLGPLYGAAYLWVARTIYKAREPATFDLA